MYYVEVKAPGGLDGDDEHYRSGIRNRGEAMDAFWTEVHALNNPLVDVEDVRTEDGDFDTIFVAMGNHPDYSVPVNVSMYWED